jgi:hypothetical protein
MPRTILPDKAADLSRGQIFDSRVRRAICCGSYLLLCARKRRRHVLSSGIRLIS